jgi:hypothetical protein
MERSPGSIGAKTVTVLVSNLLELSGEIHARLSLGASSQGGPIVLFASFEEGFSPGSARALWAASMSWRSLFRLGFADELLRALEDLFPAFRIQFFQDALEVVMQRRLLGIRRLGV